MSSKQFVLSIGGGLRVRVNANQPSRDSGVLTAHVPANSIGTVNQNSIYTFARTAMPLTFPGSVMLRQDVNATLRKGGDCIIVAYYGSGLPGAGGFQRVMSRTPAGYRDMLIYDLSDEYVQNYNNYSGGHPRKGVLQPKIRRVPLMTIRWSSLVYTDFRPTDNGDMFGKYNSNTYIVDGYVHAPRTLRFEGTQIIHEKYGGIDRWVRNHTAVFDAMKWENEQARKDPTDPAGKTYTRLPNAKLYNDDDVTTFRNLP